MPNYLPSGSTYDFLVVESYGLGASVILNYQCEGDHQITIFSHSNLSLRQRKTQITYNVRTATNMRGTITWKEQNYLKGFSAIHWNFEATDPT